MPWALTFALARAGSSNPARIAMMAITTRSSMSVNPRCRFGRPPAPGSPSEMKPRININGIYLINNRVALSGQPAKLDFSLVIDDHVRAADGDARDRQRRRRAR